MTSNTRAKYERLDPETVLPDTVSVHPHQQLKRKPVYSYTRPHLSPRIENDNVSSTHGDGERLLNDIPLGRLPSPSVIYQQPITPKPDEGTRQGRSGQGWMPVTMKWPYLATLTASTALLIGVVLYLDQRSIKYNGLADSSSKSTLVFGWRFAPTLFAVLYSLLLTIWLGDTSRIEPYLRLTRSQGAKADFTILRVLDSWWTILAYGSSKSKTGGSRSYALLCSLGTVIVAALIISPLSSTFLALEDVILSQNISFSSFSTLEGQPLALANTSLTRFHTLSHLLQNASTSAWITEQYAILPFWPSSMETPPLGANFGSSAGVWRVKTLVLSAEMICTPLYLRSRVVTPELIKQNSTRPMYDYLLSFVLANDNGCSHGIAFDYSILSNQDEGNVLWFDSGQPPYENQQGSGLLAWSFNRSSRCTGTEAIMVASNLGSRNTSQVAGKEWQWSSDVQASSLDCVTQYYSAKIPVSMTVTDKNTLASVDFDKEAFYTSRQVISDGIIDVQRFENLFQDSEWSLHLTSSPHDMTVTDGAATLLQSLYDFSPSAISKDQNFTSKAQKAKQRYFGEVLISSLQAANTPYVETAGTVSVVQPRIMVVHPAAYAIAAALAVNLILLLASSLMLRRQRQDNLHADPAQVMTVARMLVDGTCSRHELKVLSATSILEREQILKGRDCKIDSDRLIIGNGIEIRQTLLAEAYKDSTNVNEHEWKAFVLKKWSVASLCLVLAFLLSIIIFLYYISRSSGLYQRAFVFQVDVRFSDHSSTIAPYSIMPTLLAVGVGLWWGAIETNLRSLQPFLSMANEPVPYSKGIGLSYLSTYSIWAVAKAGWLRHWLLCLVCTGAVLSQIFTISMSALWRLEEGRISSQSVLQRTLEPRQIPLYQALNVTVGPRTTQMPILALLQGLYGELTINWLYGANIEMTLNGTGPPWSRDDWSFIPMDLNSLQANHDQSLNTSVSNLSNSSVSTLIKVKTPAVRARLECSPYQSLSNTSLWLTPANLTDPEVWNVTRNPVIDEPVYCLGDSCRATTLCLVPNATSRYDCNLLTPYYAYEAILGCCEDSSKGRGGEAVIAYWSQNTAYEVNQDSERQQRDNNFTVKWIYGRPVEVFQGPTQRMLVWKGKPQMTAINCKPVIEHANAEVQVEQSTEKIQTYEILERPTTDESALGDGMRVYTLTQGTWDYYRHVTISYGQLFLFSLTHAVDQLFYTTASGRIAAAQEQYDYLFKFRRPGINMDTMSYSMFSQVNQSMTALLDPKLLEKEANKTFATFFKHFVNFNLSTENGGLIYQKIDETLPTAIKTEVLTATALPPLPEKFFQPSLSTNRTANAEIFTPVKMLRMSSVAVWLGVSILTWLLLTAGILLVVEKMYLGKIIRSTKTLADVGILVAGSDALLTHIASGKPDFYHGRPLETKLGWFRDKEGIVRWGIELYGPGCSVEWLDEQEVLHEVMKSTKPAK